jgi:hypothetical protein
MNKVEFLAMSLPSGLKAKIKINNGLVSDTLNFDIDAYVSMLKDNVFFVPVIRHPSALTKPCVQSNYNGGEPFIPIVELAKIEKLIEPISFDIMKDLSRGVRGCCAKDRFDNQWLMYSYSNDGFSLWHKPYHENEHRPTLLENQFQLFQQLIKWHFWPDMPENESVVYVDDNFNPYTWNHGSSR